MTTGHLILKAYDHKYTLTHSKYRQNQVHWLVMSSVAGPSGVCKTDIAYFYSISDTDSSDIEHIFLSEISDNDDLD